MKEFVLKTNKTIDDYNDGIKKLILDITEELKNGVKDGISMKIAAQKGDEASVFGFLKEQGYEIVYKEFSEFYQDSQKIVEDNEESLVRIMEEKGSKELNDSDLEQVAGGSWLSDNWKLTLGVGLLVGAVAVTIATGGAGAPLIGAALEIDMAL